MKTSTIVFLFVLHFFCLQAQQNQLSTTLKEYMAIVREEPYAPAPDKSLYSETNAQEMLQLLQPYYSDSTVKVRQKAYYLTYKSCYKTRNPQLRESATYNLVLALKDDDSGNVGNAADWLASFYKQDFNEKAKDSLRSILHRQVYYLDKIIKLAGFVDLQDQVGYIQNNLANGNYSANNVIWAAHLALARMGVDSEIEFCVSKVKSLPVNDDVIYEMVPDLIFTRQKEAFQYIIKILNSNEKNCFSSNPENARKIRCGYRVMEYIAPAIKDFPLEVDETGDLIIDDYERSLEITRNWFNSREGEYEIITNRY